MKLRSVFSKTFIRLGLRKEVRAGFHKPSAVLQKYLKATSKATSLTIIETIIKIETAESPNRR